MTGIIITCISENHFLSVVCAGQVWRNPRGKSKPPGNRRLLRSWCETSPSRPRWKNCENSSGKLGFTFNRYLYCFSCVCYRTKQAKLLTLEIIVKYFSLTKMTMVVSWFWTWYPCNFCKIVMWDLIQSASVVSFCQYVWRAEDSPSAKERDRWSPPWFWLHWLPH